jgi:hypothetical protein
MKAKQLELLMPRSIQSVSQVMRSIAVITEKEEGNFDTIAGWDGEIMSWTDKSVLACLRVNGKYQEVWLPLSQLRKTEDESEIYASFWLKRGKDLD